MSKGVQFAQGGTAVDPYNGLYSAHLIPGWKWLAGLVLVALMAAGIWAVQYDIGAWYEVLLGVTAALPWIAFWLCRRYPRAFFLSPPAFISDESLFGFLAVPAAVLWFRAFEDVQVVHAAPLYPFMALLAVLMLACVLWVAPPYRRNVWYSLAAGFVVCVYAHGAVILTNALFDFSAPEVQEVRVASKFSTGSKAPTFYFGLDFHRNGALPVAANEARLLDRVTVPVFLYRATSVGDMVCVRRHSGLLGARWISVARS